MKNNADLDFAISNEELMALRNIETIKDYSNAGMFPVYRSGL